MNFIFVEFMVLLTLANHSQTLHKALRALFSLWVIRWRLHIDKIHKNKIEAMGLL